MKLSEVNLSTKNVEQINNIKKAPVILNQRMTKPVSDSFVNTSISKKEEKQNFLQKAWNKLKTIFSSKKEVNSSIQNENLDLDITSSIKNSTVSFKGPKKVNKATDREALISLNKSTILNSLNISESELTAFINRDNVKVKYPVSVDNIVATLLSNNIPVEDFIEVYNSKKEVSDNNFEGKALARTMNVLKNYSQIVCKEVFEPFNLNFKDANSWV